MKNKKKYYLYTMNMNVLNTISIVLVIASILLVALVMKLTHYDLSINNKEFAIFYLLMIPYFIFHEILHSIGYVVNGANFKNITYGVHLEKGVLCCLVKENVNKKNILWSLVYPFLFIGVITLIIGFLLHNAGLIFLSVMNISGCSGDLLMFIAFSKLKDFEYSEYDDPTSFALYGDKSLENLHMYGLKYVGVADKLDRTITKKVDVSKSSIVIIIIFLLIGLINFI